MKKMIRFLATTILVLFVTSLCLAQENIERTSIEVEKKGLGYRYTYQDKPLKKLAEFFPIMENSPEAVSQSKRSRTSRGVAMSFSIVGGFLIGWPLGQALTGRVNTPAGPMQLNDPNWVLAGVGGGLVVVAVVFGVKSDKQLKKGVDIYNESIAFFNSEPHDFKIAFALNSLCFNVWF